MPNPFRRMWRHHQHPNVYQQSTLEETPRPEPHEQLLDGLELLDPEVRRRKMELRIFYQKLTAHQGLTDAEDMATRRREG